MTEIRIKYENDRGTPQPDRVHMPGETGQASHPRLWEILIDDPTEEIQDWKNTLPCDRYGRMAAFEVAAATLKLEQILGITDPTNDEDWKSKGVDISYSQPGAGFVNWPDPDLGKGW